MEIVSREQKRQFTILALALIILQAIDGILTTFLLNNNLGYEGMPVVSSIAGCWWFGLAKFIFTASVLFILWKRLGGQERNFRIANKGLLVLVIIFSLIVGWNLSIFGMSSGGTVLAGGL